MPKNTSYRISALEAMVQKLVADAGSDPTAHKLADFGKQLVVSAKALRDLDANPDPTISESTHISRVGSAARRLLTNITNVEEDLMELLKEGQSGLAEKIKAKVNLVPDPAYAAEIRQVVRALPLEKRLEMLNKFAETNDGPSMAAVVDCPSVLCSIPPDLQARFRSQILLKHAPQEMAQSKALLEALQLPLKAASVAKEYAREFGDHKTSASPEREAQLTKQKEAALAAMAAFDAAIPQPQDAPAAPVVPAAA